jgi:hypothetical protein
MHEVVNVDYKAVDFDVMRLAQPSTEAEKNIRRGCGPARTGLRSWATG